ncbi:MAG: DoxX family protein [Acidobacteriota bacterium]
MSSFVFGSVKLNSVAGDFGLLVLRAFAGVSLALAHGLGKLPPPERFVAGVANLGFPAPVAFAWLSGLAETVCGLLLAAGLGTRAAAAVIAINMSVAGFLRHAADPYNAKELAFLFLAVAVCFLFTGGGRFALDRLIRK